MSSGNFINITGEAKSEKSPIIYNSYLQICQQQQQQYQLPIIKYTYLEIFKQKQQQYYLYTLLFETQFSDLQPKNINPYNFLLTDYIVQKSPHSWDLIDYTKIQHEGRVVFISGKLKIFQFKHYQILGKIILNACRTIVEDQDIDFFQENYHFIHFPEQAAQKALIAPVEKIGSYPKNKKKEKSSFSKVFTFNNTIYLGHVCVLLAVLYTRYMKPLQLWYYCESDCAYIDINYPQLLYFLMVVNQLFNGCQVSYWWFVFQIIFFYGNIATWFGMDVAFSYYLFFGIGFVGPIKWMVQMYLIAFIWIGLFCSKNVHLLIVGCLYYLMIGIHIWLSGPWAYLVPIVVSMLSQFFVQTKLEERSLSNFISLIMYLVHFSTNPARLFLGAIYWYFRVLYGLYIYTIIQATLIWIDILDHTSRFWRAGTRNIFKDKSYLKHIQFSQEEVEGKKWTSCPDFNCDLYIAQNGKKSLKFQPDYCVTMAFAYIYNLISLDLTQQTIRGDDDIETFLSYVNLIGRQVDSHLCKMNFLTPTSAKYNGQIIQPSKGNPFKTPVYQNVLFKEHFVFQEAKEKKHEFVRVDIRIQDIDLLRQYLAQEDLKITEDPSELAHILIHQCHCYINVDLIVEWRQRFQPKVNRGDLLNHINHPTIIKMEGQQEQEVVYSQNLVGRIKKMLDEKREILVSLPTGYLFNITYLKKAEGHIELLPDSKAIICQGIDFVVVPTIKGLPFDYSMSDILFTVREDIAFNAQLVEFKDTRQKMEACIPYKNRVYSKQGVYDLEMYKILKDLLNQVPLTYENICTQKYRYLETFSGLSFQKNNNSILNDLANEYDELVITTMCKAVQDLRTERTTYQELVENKPSWYQILNRKYKLTKHFGTKYVAKTDETIEDFIIRKLEDENYIYLYMVKLVFMFIEKSDDDIVTDLIYLHDSSIKMIKDHYQKVKNRVITKKQDLMEAIQFFPNMWKAGSRKLITEFYHKTDIESYDICKTNPMVLKYMHFYNPNTKLQISDTSAQNIYNTYLPYCTCSKNKCKYSVNENFKNLGEQVNFATYGVCPLNAISAIVTRQAASLLTYDQNMYLDFQKFVERHDYIDKFLYYYDLMDKTQYTFDSYIQHIKLTDNQKSISYRKGRYEAIKYRIKTILQCFPKSGEYFLKHQNQSVQQLSNRSRNICSPDTTLLGVANHANFIGLSLLKKVCPEYSSYLNNDDLQTKIDRAWLDLSKYGKPCGISSDFSSHDSNQHAELIELVDNRLWKKLFPKIWPLLGLPQHLYKQSLESIIQNDSVLQYKTKIGKFFRKLFQVKIRGTVTSGHPTRTTFGNTLRVILFWQYVFECLEITKYKMFVGGDDFFAILLQEDSLKVQQHITKYFSTEQCGALGLGQCTKKINILGNKIDFLSKIGCIQKSGTYTWRNFGRIAHKQPYTDSQVKDKEILRVAQFFSFLHSGYSLSFVTYLCSTYIQFQNKSIQHIFKIMASFISLVNKNIIQLFKDIKVQNLISTNINKFVEPYFMDSSVNIGDHQGTNKYIFYGMYQEVKNQSFSWLTLNLRPKKVSKHNYISSNRKVFFNGATQTYKNGRIAGRSEVKNISNYNRVVYGLLILISCFLVQHTRYSQNIYTVTEKININQQTSSVEGQNASVADCYQSEFLISYQILRKCYNKIQNLLSMVDEQLLGIWCKKFDASVAENTASVIDPDRPGQKIGARNGKNKQNKKAVDNKQDKQIKQIKSQIKVLTVSNPNKNRRSAQFNKGTIYGQQNKNQIKQVRRNIKHSPFVCSVLKPFDTAPIKPPYDYPLNSCIFDQTLEFNCSATLSVAAGAIPSGTYGVAVGIFPHAINEPSSLSAGASYAAGAANGNLRYFQQYKSGTGGYADVIANASHPMATYQGLNNGANARWTSCRLIRAGIRLIPTSAMVSRAGIVQIVQIPGKDDQLNLGNAFLGAGTIPFPNTSQIKTYPTSYEASNASNIVKHDYVWVPTDLQDTLFMTDQVGYTASLTSGALEGVSGEMDMLVNHLRNGMYILATNLAQTDTYRLEVKLSYEYIPTTTFRQWGDTSGQRAQPANLTELKDVVINNPTTQADQSTYSSFMSRAGEFVNYATDRVITHALDRFQDGLQQNYAQSRSMQMNRIKF